tara:strand:- start:1487 stop:2026 length:540 start_codon:yes stop_codon:yes gene_type:complete
MAGSKKLGQGTPTKASRARQQTVKNGFLKALEEGASVSRACRDLGVSRSAIYLWRRTDQKFTDEWLAAEDAGTDRMEDELWRRAVEGVEKPTGFYQGEPGAFVREYSDTLLIFGLKGRRPEKYADRSRVTMNGNIDHSHKYDLSKLDDKTLDKLETILEAAESDTDTTRTGETPSSAVH